MGLALGVDVGGTFTDAVAVDEETSEMKWSKVYSTPPTFVEGVINSINALDIPCERVSKFSHGTTIGINAVVARQYAQVTGLICTKGFRDFLDIRRARRRDLFNPWWVKSKALTRRKCRLGVTERINYKGEVLTPLDEDEVVDAVKYLKRKGILSYAVCLLHSYKNPLHEKKIKEIIRREHPEAFISISAEVCPIIREYERTSTTVINAILMPTLTTYIERLERSLKELGITSPILFLKSNGGIMSSDTAKVKPVEILEGGHAAGCIASSHIGQLTKDPNIITYDGGGTTATQSVIEGGQFIFEPLLDLEWGIISYPPSSVVSATPTISIRSIGQGGGAIAWVDKGGVLNVGPQSAGAVPGPVCYGLGGTEPTITDALVILGILDPHHDWIRRVPWKREEAINSITTKIAEYYHWELNEACAGILKIAVSNVSSVFHEAVIAKGRDPRDFTLMAFGGSGPSLAPAIAEEHEIRKVIVPMATGTTSALGCLLADVMYDYQHSYLTLLEEIDYGKLKELFGLMEKWATDDLARDHIVGRPTFHYSVDFRYLGERWEVTVPLEGVSKNENITPETLGERGVEAFHREHNRLYGFDRPDEPVEAVTLRLRVIVPTPKPSLRKIEQATDASRARIGSREIVFDIETGPEKAEIYDYERLGAGAKIAGPAVIHKYDGTVPIYPRSVCLIDEYGNILIQFSR